MNEFKEYIKLILQIDTLIKKSDYNCYYTDSFTDFKTELDEILKKLVKLIKRIFKDNLNSLEKMIQKLGEKYNDIE